MGRYTDVAIAIDKDTYAKHALLKKVPRVLLEEPYIEKDNALHWYLEGQKWYSHFDEVQEVHSFLAEIEDALVPKTLTFPDGDQRPYQIPPFGLLLLHEDGHIEREGDTYEYGIEEVTYIDCPGRDAMLEKEASS